MNLDEPDISFHPRDQFGLVGHDAPIDDFMQSWKTGKMHHAWILHGPEGIGKATFAYHIARFILAQNEEDAAVDMFGEPIIADFNIPEEHPISRRISAQSEPRIKVLERGINEKTGKIKTAISVDDVRNAKSFFELSTTASGWRVALVDSADEMNTAAANALLKTLEEPPARTIFLLISHQAGKLLPTIRSRCRTLALNPLIAEDMQKVMQLLDADINPDQTKILTELAAGAPGKAYQMHQAGNLDIYANLLDLFAELPKVNRSKISALSDAVKTPEDLQGFQFLLAHILTKIARCGVVPQEDVVGKIASNISPDLPAARVWAEAVQDISGKLSIAGRLNLDAGLTVLNTLNGLPSIAKNAIHAN